MVLWMPGFPPVRSTRCSGFSSASTQNQQIPLTSLGWILRERLQWTFRNPLSDTVFLLILTLILALLRLKFLRRFLAHCWKIIPEECSIRFFVLLFYFSIYLVAEGSSPFRGGAAPFLARYSAASLSSRSTCRDNLWKETLLFCPSSDSCEGVYCPTIVECIT